MTSRSYKTLVILGKTAMFLGALVVLPALLPLGILFGPPLALLSAIGHLWPAKPAVPKSAAEQQPPAPTTVRRVWWRRGLVPVVGCTMLVAAEISALVALVAWLSDR
jgi:hypothetical protein